MTLTNALKILFILSQAENDEEEGHSAKTPMGLSFPPIDRRQMEYLEAERPAGDALEAFVNDLDKKKLTAIAALMYSGRENCELDLAEQGQRGAEELVLAIIEKEPRTRYIAAGIERYGVSRIEELVQ